MPIDCARLQIELDRWPTVPLLRSAGDPVNAVRSPADLRLLIAHSHEGEPVWFAVPDFPRLESVWTRLSPCAGVLELVVKDRCVSVQLHLADCDPEEAILSAIMFQKLYGRIIGSDSLRGVLNSRGRPLWLCLEPEREFQSPGGELIGLIAAAMFSDVANPL